MDETQLRNTPDDDALANAQTRRMLYQLITHLRRNARSTDNASNRALFLTSAEMVAGLARVFRRTSRTEQNNDNGDQ